MLSRDQFELACHIFAARHSHWSWVSGGRPGYGYLTRTRYHRWKTPFDSFSYVDSINLEEVEVEEDDQATAQLSEPPSLIVHEYIVYSASFNVPSFYFTMQDSSACTGLIRIEKIWKSIRRELLVLAGNNADIIVKSEASQWVRSQQLFIDVAHTIVPRDIAR